MRILHTSDWHLGRTLCGRSRLDEASAFLDWLLALIDARGVEALLVAGDVFDGVSPTHRAQALYYDFLHRLSGTGCRSAVVVAGNHDSPSLLDAPKALLGALRVRVVGTPSDAAADDLRVLPDAAGAPGAIVAPLPFLRDRDTRAPEEGESVEDRDRQTLAGIRRRYADAFRAAVAVRQTLGGKVPIVMTGHLFAAGATLDDDDAQDPHVGSLARVPADVFPPEADYVALGHLHRAQTVNGDPRRRYSGAPLVFGFNEAEADRVVLLVDFDPADESKPEPTIEAIPVPKERRLARIRGDWETLAARMAALPGDGGWLEVIYDGAGILPDLRDRLEQALRGRRWEAVRVRYEQSAALTMAEAARRSREDSAVAAVPDEARLDEDNDPTPDEVFELRLIASHIPEDQRDELRQTHREAFRALNELAEAERSG